MSDGARRAVPRRQRARARSPRCCGRSTVLPERLTPVGILEFCDGLRQIALENQAAGRASASNACSSACTNPRYYPTLPGDARKIYFAGVHFARAVFATFREDGRRALESADALDALDMKFYAMIASQIRFLYHMNRGDLRTRAAASPAGRHPRRARRLGLAGRAVGARGADPDLHVAARRRRHGARRRPAGGAGEGRAVAAPVRAARALGARAGADRCERSRRTAWRSTMIEQTRNRAATSAGRRTSASPRWVRACSATTQAARRLCDIAGRAHDRRRSRVRRRCSWSPTSSAPGARRRKGHPDRAIAQLEALLERYAESDNPLVHGLIHEARAQIAHAAGRESEFAAERGRGRALAAAARQPGVDRQVRAPRGPARRAVGRARAGARTPRSGAGSTCSPATNDLDERIAHGLELLRRAADAPGAAFYRRRGDQFVLDMHTRRRCVRRSHAARARSRAAALRTRGVRAASDAHDRECADLRAGPRRVRATGRTERCAKRICWSKARPARDIVGAIVLNLMRISKPPPNGLLRALAQHVELGRRHRGGAHALGRAACSTATRVKTARGAREGAEVWLAGFEPWPIGPPEARSGYLSKQSRNVRISPK